MTKSAPARAASCSLSTSCTPSSVLAKPRARPTRRHIAHAGFDPVYGARPLKRFLQREIETRIARLLVAGDMPEGSRVEVVLDEGQLAVRHQPLEAGTEI
ncbi:MAG: hypothetical protein F4Z85_25470 [Gemmatimonadetes bacterium]|nr:hypothetical protein [Gemmatimonadota bacterium]MYB71314.1 hypothetical protein [Gemmatimonadota bacterium]